MWLDGFYQLMVHVLFVIIIIIITIIIKEDVSNVINMESVYNVMKDIY